MLAKQYLRKRLFQDDDRRIAWAQARAKNGRPNLLPCFQNLCEADRENVRCVKTFDAGLPHNPRS